MIERSGGRGRIRPIEDRVRVIAHGAGLIDITRFRGRVRPIVTFALPEPDSPDVLGITFRKGEL